VRSSDSIPPAEEQTLHGDFMVTTIDLRIRIQMLVGSDSDALSAADSVEGAQRSLWWNPDTLAWILVADNDELTCSIIEFGDTLPGTAKSSVIREQTRSGPLGDTLRGYLGSIIPSWPVSSDSLQVAPLDFEGLARESAHHELGDRKQKIARIPELTGARNLLSDDDQAWAAQLAIAIIRGEATNVDEALARRDGETDD
jgi:hypothetical protein